MEKKPQLLNQEKEENRGEHTGAISLSEFARLLSLLNFDADLCALVVESARKLTRTELDIGRNRDAFWETEVSTKYMTSEHVQWEVKMLEPF